MVMFSQSSLCFIAFFSTNFTNFDDDGSDDNGMYLSQACITNDTVRQKL